MLIQTANLGPNDTYDGRLLPASERNQVYCGLDCCLTLEILEVLNAEFPSPSLIYNFERALQAPYLSIMHRGFLVDQISRRAASIDLRDKISALQFGLDQFSRAIWDKPLNPNSPAQLKEFFYKALRLPEVWISKKGERKVSVDREALEKLDAYLYARPFINSILAIRDLKKQLEVFECDIDSDGRFRAGYNIAGTETGRPSSSENAFGTGRNAQNIAPGLRYVFTADIGWKICVIDLEQVEARDVGFFIGCLFDDWTFLDNCESGDLHSNNAKMIWPHLPWTGDKVEDRKIADRQFYRDFTYRDMAKRGSHLSNYSGTAWTAARSLKVEQGIMEEFQARYCRGRAGGYNPKTGREIEAIIPAFPGIPRWWAWTAEQLQTKQKLVTPFGRERHFFGRPGDDTTLREAIAFLPQSTTADRMNLGLWRVWKHEPEIQLLAQTYDSITFQFRENEDEDNLLPRILGRLEVELWSPNGRRYVVPGEAKVGWNWGAEVTQADVDKAKAKGLKPPRLNPEGLRKWKEGVKDRRSRATGLKRIMV